MGNLRYPIGVQSFGKIRRDGYVYVDKTWCIPLLERNAFYFLGRPRRFGKSLLLSMLHEYYEGKRELFRGLAIDRLRPEEWVSRPVFHIDLNNERYGVHGSVVAIINKHLERWEEIYGDAKKDRPISERFEWLVREACRRSGHRVVVLIDEYDKPLTDNILNDELFNAHREDLRGFYASLKTLDPCIKLALLTGVTKFGKLNVFSGLNNLNDISLSDEFSAICGITEDELHSYFDCGVRSVAEKRKEDVSEMYAELKRRYDGYHFSEESPDIYNPFSLLLTLAHKIPDDYWFSTGTAKMLVDLVIRNRIPLRNLDGVECYRQMLSDITHFGSAPIPLLYQTGYLTIKGYDSRLNRIRLGFPNLEVERGFLNEFMREYGGISEEKSEFCATDMSDLLRDGDAKGFLNRLNAFFASIPYDLRKYQSYESYWQTVMYVLLTMLGYHTEAERHTSEGSIDLLVKTGGYIYVVELKVADRRRKNTIEEDSDGDLLFVSEPEPEYGDEREMTEEEKAEDMAEVKRVLEKAVRQIEERCYAAAYAADGRKVIKIAAVFSAARHCLVAAKIF